LRGIVPILRKLMGYKSSFPDVLFYFVANDVCFHDLVFENLAVYFLPNLPE
jgi:hypothetical protein